MIELSQFAGFYVRALATRSRSFPASVHNLFQLADGYGTLLTGVQQAGSTLF